MNNVSFLNRHYQCCVCDKLLGTRYERLKGKKTPSVYIVDGKQYCQKHYLQKTCTHQHTIIDKKALRQGDKRFLICWDCGKEDI